MTPPQPTSPTCALSSLLGRREVEALARHLGVQLRSRKVCIWTFTWTLVLAFQSGAERTLTSLREAYERTVGHTLARSSFHARLNPRMARLLRRLAKDSLAQMGQALTVQTGRLSAFKDLLALDATVLRLREMASKAWLACRTNHTSHAAKLHVVMRICDGSPNRVKLTGERVGDTGPWTRLGKWVEGCLLLFDLGYYNFHLFARLDNRNGFFISRAKRNFNPVITGVNRRWRGNSIDVEGQRLQDVLPRLQRQVLDVEVEVTYKKRRYRGRRRTATRRFRLVAIRNAETGEYHLYLTNVPVEMLPAEDIGHTYALRWQVELLFKAMRSHGHLGQLPSRKKAVIECLVWASVLATVASQTLYRMIRKMVDPQRHMPLLRWASRFAKVASELLELLIHPNNERATRLLQQLVHDAPDPNRSRRDRSLLPVPQQVLA